MQPRRIETTALCTPLDNIGHEFTLLQEFHEYIGGSCMKMQTHPDLKYATKRYCVNCDNNCKCIYIIMRGNADFSPYIQVMRSKLPITQQYDVEFVIVGRSEINTELINDWWGHYPTSTRFSILKCPRIYSLPAAMAFCVDIESCFMDTNLIDFGCITFIGGMKPYRNELTFGVGEIHKGFLNEHPYDAAIFDACRICLTVSERFRHLFPSAFSDWPLQTRYEYLQQHVDDEFIQQHIFLVLRNDEKKHIFFTR